MLQSMESKVADSAAASSLNAEEFIRHGDSRRDSQDLAGAAEHYRAALALAPQRTDIRVQLGNMLKDTGRHAEAEETYRRSMADRPQDADIRLQLGHVLKLQGRRAAALAEYRRAVELDPFLIQAVMELANAGAPDGRLLAYEAQLRAGGAEAVMTMVGELAAMRDQVDQMLAALPSVQSWVATPLALYGLFRQFFDVPSPPHRACSITVMLLADMAPLDTVHAQLAGLRAQSHLDWRLLALGTDPVRRQVVMQAAATDPRFAWAELDKAEPTTRAELRLASAAQGQWCLLLASGAVLHQHALGWVAVAAGIGNASAFVCDEVVGHLVRGSVEYSAPTLRQVVDYDTLLEANVFGETIALRNDVAALLPPVPSNSVAAARSALLLHLAYEDHIGHIPLPLIWRSVGDVPSPTAHREAVAAHLTATRSAARIDLDPRAAAPSFLPITWQASEPNALVGVIILTQDNAADVEAFVASLLDTAAIRSAVRIVVVDNNGQDDAARQRLELLAQSGAMRLLTMHEPFNWSRLNNLAAAVLDTPLVVFANDDMRMLTVGWDERLRGLLGRPCIGAVGARLLYPDDTIQHAGILFGWTDSPTHHDGLYEPVVAHGPAGRWQVSRRASAVTGAFLATRRETFIAQGGFDEAGLWVSYGDIDYALRLRSAGLAVLWTPRITLYHCESKTRGFDHQDLAKTARNMAEEKVMRARWGMALSRDPSINPTWRNAVLPFRLIAAPSDQSIQQHIQDCASPQPWLPRLSSSDSSGNPS